MKFALFPADDKYLTEDWSLTNLKWIKNLPKDTPITEGIVTEKQFVVFKLYMTDVLPKLIFDIFLMFIADKKQSKRWRKELSDLLFEMKQKQVEIDTGLAKSWLNNVYPGLIKLLDLHLSFSVPEPEKRIYGFRLNLIEYDVTKKDKAIEMLFDGLKKAKLIAPDTEFNIFRTIFDSTSPIEPVVWTGQKNQLLYFFWLLYRRRILQGKGKEHPHDWEKMDRCFVKKDGKSFELKKDRKSFGEFDNKTGIAVNKREPIKNLLDSIVEFWKNREP
jgi:CRISPR/Cas system-associated protein endoribonuclease Cas2